MVINLALSQRVSIKFTQDNVGHSKSETTLNVYAENNSDMIADAVDKINNVFTACWKNVGKSALSFYLILEKDFLFL